MTIRAASSTTTRTAAPATARARALLASAQLGALLIAGCSSSEDGATSSGSGRSDGSGASDGGSGYVTPRTVPEGKGSGEDDGVFPRTVLHFAGETETPAEPTAVVVISTGQADALLTLGTAPSAPPRATAQT